MSEATPCPNCIVQNDGSAIVILLAKQTTFSPSTLHLTKREVATYCDTGHFPITTFLHNDILKRILILAPRKPYTIFVILVS